ncbi:phosphoglycerate mutase-like protein [Cylindrobasidium torrendii FP15055 ss-10]|uniref:Phosphoglycerate mutase-like protein n=1 Tax=Cylindrobasidium torrendii FP15055 ss-10 TaxID=1314674 RepID=A0A0D7BNA6_9AGAR|nr:phosphoglycerate mutase-like protein [Cylindrobasidium torrendii FP15055 ss-10]
MTVARVYLVRHGETESNRQEIVQGQLDTALNEQGLNQAKILGLALKDIPFDLGYSSDLSRASKTAEIILSHHPKVPLLQRAQLRERHLGQLQGKTYAEKRAAVNINNDPTAEAGDVFLKRGLEWWDEMVTEAAQVGAANVLAVSHGGFISTLVKGLLRNGKVTSEMADGGQNLWKCWNCSITSIDIDLETAAATLIKYGDTAHLDGKFKMVESNVDVQAEEAADAAASKE